MTDAGLKKNKPTAQRAKLCALPLLILIGCAIDAQTADVPEGTPLAQATQADPSDTGTTAATTPPDATTQPDAAPTVPMPQAPYFAEIIANGTGCPRGSWETSISKDGSKFITNFSQYEVEVNETRSTSVKDCLITLKLKSAKGISVAVKSLSYKGYAYLDTGVKGTFLVTPHLSGQPIASKQLRVDLLGPVDRHFTGTDEVLEKELVWSQCSSSLSLNLNTRLFVQNGSPRRVGYMNLSTADVPSPFIDVGLVTRPCPSAE